MRILRIAQIDPIRVQANVAQKDVGRISGGAPVRVRSSKNAGVLLEGKVTSVFPATDPQSRTSIVEAVIANREHRLLPGDYLSVEITYGRNEHALGVPIAALVRMPSRGSGAFAEQVPEAVWVAVATTEKVEYTCVMHPEVISDKPGKCPKCGMALVPKRTGQARAHLVEVSVGLRSEEQAEITAGLKPGDQVIYAGHQDLKEGDPVFLTSWGAEGPLGLPAAPSRGAAMPGMEHGDARINHEMPRGRQERHRH